MSYYPQRPVRSFQDLEVYQKTLAISVLIVKRIPVNHTNPMTGLLNDNALRLPLKIATSHSLRFSDQQKAIDILEDAMLSCNVLVVYLEQYRDIYNTEIESAFFEEQIKNLLITRRKIMHLQMSWRKFMEKKQEKQN